MQRLFKIKRSWTKKICQPFQFWVTFNNRKLFIALCKSSSFVLSHRKLDDFIIPLHTLGFFYFFLLHGAQIFKLWIILSSYYLQPSGILGTINEKLRRDLGGSSVRLVSKTIGLLSKVFGSRWYEFSHDKRNKTF